MDLATLAPPPEGPVRAIAHPFRVEHTGSVAHVDAGSVDHATDLVAVTLLTRKGERVLVPEFGVADPVFAEVDVEELNAVITTYGPQGVTVSLAEETHPTETSSTVSLVVTMDD